MSVTRLSNQRRYRTFTIVCNPTKDDTVRLQGVCNPTKDDTVRLQGV